jgi:hypothetical protein
MSIPMIAKGSARACSKRFICSLLWMMVVWGFA